MTKPLILAILAICLFGNAQNYTKDIVAVSRNMALSDNFLLTMNYQLFVDDSPMPFQQQEIELKKKGRNLFARYSGGLEAMYNEDFVVSVDNIDKTFFAKRRDSLEGKDNENGQFLTGVLDTLRRYYGKVAVLSISGDKITYELVYKANKTIEKTQVVLNRKTFVLCSVTHYYKKVIKVKELDKKDHKVVFKIIYKDYKQNCLKDDRYFDEKKYIVFQSGKIKPVSKYLSYKQRILND
jgi:hypothetical protein